MVFVKLQSDNERSSYQPKVYNAKFMKQYPIYYKGGSLPFVSLNNHQIYLRHHGGFFNLIDTVKTGVDLVKDNKELINSGISAVSNIANATKSISDTIKTSKELEKVKELHKANKKKKEIELTPAQLESMKRIGEGFVKF
jgi:hypothetical protein